MKDRFEWCDNFGEDIPKPFGFGLEARVQARQFGDDLVKVEDPERDGQWAIAEIGSLVEVTP